MIKRSDGNGWIDGHDIVTDSEGKIYMLGRTQNYDNSQFFIKKYNTNGEEVWTIEKDILTQGEMRIAENNGNIYVTGYASEYNNNSNQNSKIYILSLTVEGEFVWENYFDITPNYSSRLSFRVNENRIFISFFDQKSQYIFTLYSDGTLPVQNEIKFLESDGNSLQITAFTTDINDNFYITGSKKCSENANIFCLYIAKSDSIGNVLWIYETFQEMAPYDLFVDNLDNTYLYSTTHSSDLIILKLDQKGDQILSKLFGSSAIDDGRDIHVSDNGNIHVSGSTEGALFGQEKPEYTSGFITSFDSEGNHLSTNLYGSFMQGITTDNSGGFYGTGSSGTKALIVKVK